MEPMRNAFTILVGIPGGKIQPKRRLDDSIKTDHKEVRCGDMDWIRLTPVAGLCE
jgi:hypothetical protein